MPLLSSGQGVREAGRARAARAASRGQVRGVGWVVEGWGGFTSTSRECRLGSS